MCIRRRAGESSLAVTKRRWGPRKPRKAQKSPDAPILSYRTGATRVVHHTGGRNGVLGAPMRASGRNAQAGFTEGLAMRLWTVWAAAQICPNSPRIAQNVQICPKCPDLPKMSKFAQICPECPDLPRFAQNAQICPKCPELPKIPIIAQNCPK